MIAIRSAWQPLSLDDVRTVTAQLGRRPEGALAVVVRCRYGRPQVIASHPLRVKGRTADVLPAEGSGHDVSVFPTLYWLTCPMLQAAIGRLEAAGWIGRLRDEMQHDPAAVAELREAHRRTARARTGLLPAGTLEALRTRYSRQYRILTESGVAGMRDVDAFTVKCLHAHFADYLATGANPIGRRVWALLTGEGVDPRGSRTCFVAHGAACPGHVPSDVPRAAIDVGSNSVRLLVARRTDRGWERVVTRLVTTRLGATAGDGRLAPDAVSRTLEALRTLRAAAEEAGAADPVAIATSAVREAANRDELLVQAWERAGVAVRVITGEEEGQLSFRGALAGSGTAAAGPVVLLDVGGGSTEVIVGEGDGTVHVSRSLPFGAVRLRAAVAAGRALDGILADLRGQLSRLATACAAYLGSRRAVAVAVGGTATTLAALDQEMRVYDPKRVNGYKVTVERLAAWLQRIEGMDVDERRRLPGMPEGRADILPYGLMIIREAMRIFGPWTGQELVISDDDLLVGSLEQSFAALPQA